VGKPLISGTNAGADAEEQALVGRYSRILIAPIKCWLIWLSSANEVPGLHPRRKKLAERLPSPSLYCLHRLQIIRAMAPDFLVTIV
jgi:hypothetical protein